MRRLLILLVDERQTYKDWNGSTRRAANHIHNFLDRQPITSQLEDVSALLWVAHFWEKILRFEVRITKKNATWTSSTSRLIEINNSPFEFSLRWEEAPRQPRLRHPESTVGRQWQRTADAQPGPPDPSAQRAYTHTPNKLKVCVQTKKCICCRITRQHLGWRCSNNVHRSWLLTDLGRTISSSFSPVSSTLLAKYKTHTWD